MVFIYFTSVEDRERGMDVIAKSAGPYSLFEGKEKGSFLYEAPSSVLEELARQGIPHREVLIADVEGYLSKRGWEYFRNLSKFGGTQGLLAGFTGGRGRRLSDEGAERIRILLGADKPRRIK